MAYDLFSAAFVKKFVKNAFYVIFSFDVVFREVLLLDGVGLAGILIFNFVFGQFFYICSTRLHRLRCWKNCSGAIRYPGRIFIIFMLR